MQNLSTIKENTFPVGYDDKHEPDEIPAGKCVLIQNGFLEDNAIKERTGYSEIGTDTGEGTPNLLLHAHETTTHTQLLKINNNATNTQAFLYYKTALGAWTKVLTPTFTASLRCVAVTAQGKTYITNGVDVVKSWDGTTLANVPGIPVTSFLVWFHNYLWAIRSSTYRNRAFYSNLSTPETFGANDYFDINPEDSDYITGAGFLKDELVIGKRYRVYSFQGWTEASFSINAVNEKLASHGCISHQTFCNIGNDLLFLNFRGDIPNFVSLQRVRIAETNFGQVLSDEIKGTMKGLSYGKLDETPASIFDGKYAWFFLPNGASTYNDLALTYNTTNKGWQKHTGIYCANAVLSSITGEPKIYFADSRNSKVYLFDGSNSDNGTAIDFQFITRQYKPDMKYPTSYVYLYLDYVCGGAGGINVYTSIDDYNYNLEEVLALDCGQMAFPYVFPIPLGNTLYRSKRIELTYSGWHFGIQLKLTKQDLTQRAQIDGWQFLGYRKGMGELPFS